MKIKDIKSIARTMKLKPGKLNKAQLIHLIQKTEKNDECYATPAVTSGEQISADGLSFSVTIAIFISIFLVISS